MSSTIFSLRASNSRARREVERKENRHLASRGDTSLNIGANTCKSKDDLITLATLGSGSKADIYIKGNDISSIHCAFVVNYKTGVVLVEDRSPGYTRLYNRSRDTYSPLDKAQGYSRAITMDNVNCWLVMGKDQKDTVNFEIKFNKGLSDTLKIIEKRISGASERVRRRNLIKFPGQIPGRENKKVEHCTLAELGRGSYGKVFKTVDMYSGDVMAVKQMGGDRELIVARDREIYAFSRLNHPNVMNLLGYYISPRSGRTELFMPLQKGALDDLLVKTRSVAMTSIISKEVLLQMLSGLDYLAHRGFIHRDVKPSNILYETNHLGEYVFKLADFGLTNTIAAAKTRGGTGLFMAPEMWDKHGHQTPKVDMWSLYISMLWVMDVDRFRSRSKTREFDGKKQMQRMALKTANKNSDVKYIRDMVIYDQGSRASAAQMLASFGRRDLISSPGGSSISPLPKDHWNNWVKSIKEGRSPNSEYLLDLMEMEGHHQEYHQDTQEDIPEEDIQGDHIQGDHTQGDHIQEDHTREDHIREDHTQEEDSREEDSQGDIQEGTQEDIREGIQEVAGPRTK
ncbi:hypothetical protein Hte_007758 [Hypoxylon texense]